MRRADFEADMLFATLDPTARKLVLPSGLQIILVDTVGFVSRLPHHLVEAFKSTLEEAAFADVIVKVADAGDAQAAEQLAVTDEVLGSLDCADIPSWSSTTSATPPTPWPLTRTSC
ncbi:50S ribosome-binding GTPase [Gemmiger formicilis]|nr:50S ribosome-binding GTPase [Gemmiger formicilis]